MLTRTPLALALLLTVASCGGAAETPTDQPPSADQSATSTATAAATGGTLDDPTLVEPVEAALDWRDTGVPAGIRHVRGTEWEALADERSTTVELARDGDAVTIAAGSGRTISEVLMSEAWAVVVRQDKAETAPSVATAVDLATGEQRDLVSPEPASGGSWALTDGDLHYPTYGDGGAYCLATAALADGNGEDGWCAEPRTGWSGLTASEHGVAMMTFDDARPVACRTLNLLEGGLPQPVEGPERCLGWDVAATADGVLWSEVPRARRQEEARFHASADGTYYDLGSGTTGTAVPCGDSVFFVRDPQGDDEPARLLRWTPEHTLEIAYQSTSTGNAFLGEPTCGGGVLTLSAFGEDGDEQVWATVD